MIHSDVSDTRPLQYGDLLNDDLEPIYRGEHLDERRARVRALRLRRLRFATSVPAVAGAIVMGSQVFQNGMGSAGIILGGLVLTIPFLSTFNIRL